MVGSVAMRKGAGGRAGGRAGNGGGASSWGDWRVDLLFAADLNDVGSEEDRTRSSPDGAGDMSTDEKPVAFPSKSFLLRSCSANASWTLFTASRGIFAEVEVMALRLDGRRPGTAALSSLVEVDLDAGGFCFEFVLDPLLRCL
jgi:hypothetical protein